MIRVLDLLSFFIDWGYCFVFFWILHSFLPLRKSWPVRILAFLLSGIIASVVIYSNDLPNLLGALLGFSAYIAVFHQGHWARKLTAILVFYPALIAINYLTQDIGSRCFFSFTGLQGVSLRNWTREQLLISTLFHTISLLLRLLFWFFSWQFLRKYLLQITSNLTVKMWFVVDILMLASFVAIFTIIYFMPENPWIVYPICGASIFSSFGCLYLASYICTSLRTAYHAQELERKQDYYQERLQEEERVRSIYHDLKNHLLLLSAQTQPKEDLQNSIQGLKNQIREYENYYHTGNEFLDIIIRDKARAAQARNIDFSAVISLRDGAFLEPFDISTIFGNALDNSIEASEKLPEDRRLITVKAARIRDLLMITVKNNTLPQASIPRGTTKSNPFVHGFGLSNLKNAVQKYEGQCSLKAEDGVFTLKIAIPIPDPSNTR